MRHFYAWFLVSTVVWTPAALAQNADKSSSTDKTKSSGKEKWLPAGELVGRLTQVDVAQKTLTIQVKEARLHFRGIGYQNQDVPLATADDLKVRLLNPPTEFDDKGKPKRPSAKRLKELKGPGNLPGYQGDADNLKPDQMVKLSLKIRKEKTHARSSDQPATENKPVVDMVLILQEPAK